MKKEIKKPSILYKEDCKHCKGTGKHLGSQHPCTFCGGLSKKEKKEKK